MAMVPSSTVHAWPPMQTQLAPADLQAPTNDVIDNA